MRERKTLVCYANGKKIQLQNVQKIIVSTRDKELKHIQASMDVNIKNIKIMRKSIRR